MNKKNEWLELCKQSIKDAGLTPDTNEYSGEIGKQVLELCKTLSKQNHPLYTSKEQVARLFLALITHNGKFPNPDEKN